MTYALIGEVCYCFTSALSQLLQHSCNNVRLVALLLICIDDALLDHCLPARILHKGMDIKSRPAKSGTISCSPQHTKSPSQRLQLSNYPQPRCWTIVSCYCNLLPEFSSNTSLAELTLWCYCKTFVF